MMAAHIALSATSRRNTLFSKFARIAGCNHRQPRRDKYIVLLPEIPDERKETNSLLQTANYPHFSQLTTERYKNALGKLILECEYGVCQLEEGLSDGSIPKEFSSVIEHLENLSVPLDFAWGTVKHMYMVKQNDKICEIYRQFFERVQKARNRRFLSTQIYHTMKELKGDKKLTDLAQQRVADKYILEARLSGIEISGADKEHFNSCLIKLAEEKSKYRKNVEVATKKFCHTITQENEIKQFPDELKILMAEDRLNPSRGPWNITLVPHVYYPFLEYCHDSTMRWNVWQAYNTRASSDDAVNNSTCIEFIRAYRRDLAALLGYKTFADMSMETKMAGTVDNVLSMIATMHVKSKDAMEKQLAELEEFANQNGVDGKLEPWDIPYWRRRQKQELYSLDDAKLRQYFAFPSVLNGLFALCHHLFGISIKEATGEVDVWNEDVRFFKIYDEEDSHVASFYLDPYFRPEEKLFGSWMEAARNRSNVIGTLPLAYLTFNFPRPIGKTPSLLPFRDVVTLFQKFGHLLQHSLSTIPYSEVSGVTNLEWDVVDVCPYFLSFWLYDYKTVSSFATHFESGSPLPEDMHRCMRKAQRHFAAYDLATELYLSALDLELYQKKDFWMDITRNVWQQFMPYPIDKCLTYPCSFMQIFCDDYPAAYFSSKWAEMIAADAYSAFREVAHDEKAVKQVGRRFKETFLSLGGGCHAAEVFRRFRGRDPSPDALLASYGLKHIALDVAQD